MRTGSHIAVLCCLAVPACAQQTQPPAPIEPAQQTQAPAPIEPAQQTQAPASAAPALLSAAPLCMYDEAQGFLAVHFLADLALPDDKGRAREMWTIECRATECEAVKIDLQRADAGRPVSFMDVSGFDPTQVGPLAIGQSGFMTLGEQRALTIDYRGGRLKLEYSDEPSWLDKRAAEPSRVAVFETQCATDALRYLKD